MLVKDQLKIRMDQLQMPVSELAKRVGVSSQSVRHWLGGRSFPGKSKCNLIEEALSFKLDFSEGESAQSITVEQTLKQSGVDTLLSISKLPLDVQLLFSKLANAYIRVNAQVPAALTTDLHKAHELLQAQPAPAPERRTSPPRPANHGRAVGRVVRKPVSR